MKTKIKNAPVKTVPKGTVEETVDWMIKEFNLDDMTEEEAEQIKQEAIEETKQLENPN